MNGESFNGLAAYEELPMEQWYLMLEIHNDTVRRRNKAMEDANK